MNSQEIKKSIQRHLNAKCSIHGEKIMEICPVNDCSNRLLCRLCKKEHSKDHLPFTYYLKEIFEDGLGVFSGLKTINENNEKIHLWLRNEITFQIDQIRVKIEQELKALEERIYSELKEKITLTKNALDLQENFIKFLASEDGKSGIETDNFITSYHKYVNEIESKSLGDSTKALYPKVTAKKDIIESIGDSFHKILEQFTNFCDLEMIPKPPEKPYLRSAINQKYYNQMKEELNKEIEAFKQEFIRKHKEEMMVEMNQQIELMKEQVGKTERMYRDKLEITTQELIELKKLWETQEEYSERKLMEIKKQYEALLKNLQDYYEERLQQAESRESVQEHEEVSEFERKIKQLQAENDILIAKLASSNKKNKSTAMSTTYGDDDDDDDDDDDNEY
jgi:hypothetical protein